MKASWSSMLRVSVPFLLSLCFVFLGDYAGAATATPIAEGDRSGEDQIVQIETADGTGTEQEHHHEFWDPGGELVMRDKMEEGEGGARASYGGEETKSASTSTPASGNERPAASTVSVTAGREPRNNVHVGGPAYVEYNDGTAKQVEVLRDDANSVSTSRSSSRPGVAPPRPRATTSSSHENRPERESEEVRAKRSKSRDDKNDGKDRHRPTAMEQADPAHSMHHDKVRNFQTMVKSPRERAGFYLNQARKPMTVAIDEVHDSWLDSVLEAEELHAWQYGAPSSFMQQVTEQEEQADRAATERSTRGTKNHISRAGFRRRGDDAKASDKNIKDEEDQERVIRIKSYEYDLDAYPMSPMVPPYLCIEPKAKAPCAARFKMTEFKEPDHGAPPPRILTPDPESLDIGGQNVKSTLSVYTITIEAWLRDSDRSNNVFETVKRPATNVADTVKAISSSLSSMMPSFATDPDHDKIAQENFKVAYKNRGRFLLSMPQFLALVQRG
ncbi:unnamed protein product, partial [Amoebophrya sp. A120]|eukprot:GSA120T00005795001.1